MKEKKQSAVEQLRESINLLEVRQKEQGVELKNQFSVSYESLKPINLLRSSIRDLSNSTELKNHLAESILSILSGYLAQRVIIRSSKNPFRRIMGAFIQMGTTSLMAKNIDFLKDLLLIQIDRVTGFFENRKIQQEQEEL